MKVRACIREVVSMSTTKYRTIFLLLAAFVIIFVLRKMDLLEFQHKVNSTIIYPRVSTHRDIQHGFCTFQPLSSKDALEERLILDSIAWPETPVLPDPLSLEQTSDPAHSSFTILPPGRGGGEWHVGDQLEVMIKMYDFQSRPKKSGGDVLFSRLHNLKLGAGVAGRVVDHLNGSYSAVFSLLWEGSAQVEATVFMDVAGISTETPGGGRKDATVGLAETGSVVEVTLVHPSEAVTVLRRLNSEQPDRFLFHSLFRSGSLSETTTCNVCLRPTQQPLCNYTDLHTGEPWFCYKPKNLSCDTRINHYVGKLKSNLKAQEEKLFQSGVNMKVSIWASGPANITVMPQKKGQPEVKSSSVKSGPSGYYYQGLWRALGGTTVRQFNTSSAISQCLKGKMVHLYGDSTIRQWFEYFRATLPDLKEFNLHSLQKVGPYMALDYANNILVTFRFHGLPIRANLIQTAELRYIANEIDGLTGGTDTVVVLSIWAHFTPFPIEVYIRRLQSIRKAVVRLLDRAPNTLVVIRTGTPIALTSTGALGCSDWYSVNGDKVLRAMFKGLNVRLVDAWEMSLAHHLPHDIHPPPPIVKNMINVLLSYICPQKGG